MIVPLLVVEVGELFFFFLRGGGFGGFSSTTFEDFIATMAPFFSFLFINKSNGQYIYVIPYKSLK